MLLRNPGRKLLLGSELACTIFFSYFFFLLSPFALPWLSACVQTVHYSSVKGEGWLQ